MDGEVVQNIADLTRAAMTPLSLRTQDGREMVFINGTLQEVIPRQTRTDLAFIKVETLDSMVKLVPPTMEGHLSPYIVRIDSPRLVSVVDISEPTKHQTIIQAGAQCPDAGVLKGFVSLDQTLIELRECFVQTPDVEQLSEIISTVKIEDLAELVDNGLSREVSVKSRVTSGKKGDSTVVNLTLIPIRTFYEVEPVPSQFTMRWKREGEKDVKIRLIEQLSHEWRYKQMQVIAEFLNSQDSLAGIPVLV